MRGSVTATGEREAAPVMREHPQIAIDGPAGVGKSTIGERLACRLHCLYVDTGAFYRALTYLALRAAVAPNDGDTLAALARASRIQLVLSTRADGRQYSVRADNVEITRELRTPAVEANVSLVSAHAPVRVVLIERMRALADEHTVVMVGRDVGTVVLPHADLKVYLVTNIEERAYRRHADLQRQFGAACPTLSDVRADIARRDAIDARQMQPASDAVVIDNTHLQPAETVERIATMLAARFPQWLALAEGEREEA